MIKIAETRDELVACYAIVHELRDHLSVDEYLAMLEVMKGEGYRLAFLEADGLVVCCAGFHMQSTLFMGRYMYVDDLVTGAAHRSLQYGEQMMDWLKGYARDAGCGHLTLCSGVQRFSAHKFYLNQGFKIASHYFSQEL
ncbi:MAG: GNAT family N-acetyltransferase [Hyphomicrobiales bacterium]|nr:MAG: GNAT family N-acetyltransferase [Hyphomicrobiales bacterium]